MNSIAHFAFASALIFSAASSLSAQSSAPAKSAEPASAEPAASAESAASAPPVEGPKEPTSEATSAPVVANAPGVETLAFADHLFLDGDWYRAITEYRRFLFEVKGADTEAPRAALAIGEALLRGEQFDAAGRQLDGVAKRTTDPKLRGAAIFGSARAYLLDQRPELAKPRFRLLAEDKLLSKGLREEARWLLAWGHFDAGEFEAAYRLFTAISEGTGAHKIAAAGAAKQPLAESEIPNKSPLLAAALSLFPGGGHFYLGRWGVGLTSLIWNSVFIAAATQAWLSGDIGVALVLTVLELGWYSGGIFGAMAGAYKYNRDAYRNWRDQTLSDYAGDRDLPAMYLFKDRQALPGTLLRFGGTF